MAERTQVNDLKLKPCKKCGTIPTVAWDYYGTGYDRVYYIVCNCKRKPVLFATKEEAVQNWNID